MVSLALRLCLRTFAADGVDAIRFLISAAIVMNAASTLVASCITHTAGVSATMIE
eukprot:COSAG02_NODE_4753_length_5022_cov_6.019907_2_plen_55_part_00